MTLTSGSHVEHYVVEGSLGAGGMGEVYRARDTKLDRHVALKVIREASSSDPDRLARFDREARMLAALNHPHIAQIYGTAAAPDQTRCIVMELVAGETLLDRLSRGPLPVDEAVAIARQMAAALEAAHERGIVHRDLKPGNVMVDDEGRVKVLDFGLGKVLADPGSASENLTHSPTMAPTGLTGAHALVGTAAYMSPEQVRGKLADERSDVWAFGCVLYEILAGRPAFAGETVSDIMGDILRVEPDWKALPAATPHGMHAILKRCLQKDRRQRYQAVGDLRYDLETSALAPAAVAAPASNHRERLAWVAAAAAAIVATAGLLRPVFFAADAEPPVASRFLVDLPAGGQLGAGPIDPLPALSPDGRYLAFRLITRGAQRLWIRPLGSLDAREMPGTEGAAAYPFWSADSRYLGFFAGGKLKKVAAAGGPEQTLTDASGPGGTWNAADQILFDAQGGIHRASGSGGASAAIRTPDKANGEVAFGWPEFLPDGRHFLYVAFNADPGRSEVRLADLEGTRETDRPLFASISRVMYAPPGHLLFHRMGTLMAQPFDPETRALTGDAVPIAESVGNNPIGGAVMVGAAAFSVSRNGTLVYRLANQAAATELTWFDRTGQPLGVAPAQGVFLRPILFPDQKRVLLERIEGSGNDFWVLDTARGASSRFTFDPAPDTFGAVSPDGGQVAFASTREGGMGIYVKPTSGVGAEQLLMAVSNVSVLGVADWSPDGRTLLYNGVTPTGGYDTWGLPVMGERKPVALLTQPKFNEFRARFSPDGRWFLYTSNETGREEVYVQPFPPTGGKWQVSVSGGNFGYWRRDGREIIFDAPDGQVMAVDVTPGAAFEAGIPRALFTIPGTIVGLRIGVTADAQRFLIPLPVRSSEAAALRVVLNWPSELRAPGN